MICKEIFSLDWMLPVAIAILFPVIDSLLVVLILAVFTKVYPEANVSLNVQVKISVPPLPAGSDQMVKFVVGNEILPFIVSVMTTFCAVLPPLFP